MRTTSLQAYQQIRDDGLLNESQWAVYDLLFTNGPLTANEVHSLLASVPKFANKPTITPRFAELEAAGIVYAPYRRTCVVSHRLCLAYDVTCHLPTAPARRIKPNVKWLMAAVKRLTAENDAMRLRLSRWGRPTKEEVAQRNGGDRTVPLFQEA